VLTGALLGVVCAVAAGVAGLWAAAAALAIGTAWLLAPVLPSRAARAERDRLDELQQQLRDGPGAADPALLAWAFLLLTDDELGVWWRRVRPISDLPGWLTWRPNRASTWPGLMTSDGLDGLVRALAHRIGP
jgi:hypothetical protein